MPFKTLKNGTKILVRPTSAEYDLMLAQLSKPVALSASAIRSINRSHLAKIEVQEEPPSQQEQASQPRRSS